MKKIILTLFGGFIISFSFGQIERGAMLVGASSNFGLNRENPSPSTGNHITTLNLDVKGGYFVINNLAAGLRFNYNRTYRDGPSYGSTSVGIFGRYYYQGKFFGGIGITSVGPSSGNTYTEFPIEVGYAAFITKNIAIEPSLNFVKGDSQNVIGLNFGFSLYLNRGK